jgi:alkanesulfonate monooxygenase
MTSHNFMKLAVLCNNHPGSMGWTYPGNYCEGDMNFGMYSSLAKTCERGKLDVMFLADGVGVQTAGIREGHFGRGGTHVHFEPTTLLAALSQVTSQLGLVGTVSATYHHPYTIARQIASLDFLTKGRSGFNLVTSGSPEEAKNFGHTSELSSEVRYRRANEFIDAVMGLWDSFEDDAFLRDKVSGQYFDPRKMHKLNHEGEFFRIEGPLNIPRPPQGYPLISQAGMSDAGHDLAARTADIMYAKYGTLEGGRAFKAKMHEAMKKHGRAAGELAILPGFFPVIGATEEDAQRKFRERQTYLDDGGGLAMIKGLWKVDLSGYDLDGPIPDLPELRKLAHGQQIDFSRAGRRMTIREAFHWLASAYAHLSVIGTPEQVADAMQLWYQEGGADGFNLYLHAMPNSLDDFVDHVVPILQQRGVMKKEYCGGTLRENLGLPRPTWQSPTR